MVSQLKSCSDGKTNLVTLRLLQFDSDLRNMPKKKQYARNLESLSFEPQMNGPASPSKMLILNLVISWYHCLEKHWF